MSSCAVAHRERAAKVSVASLPTFPEMCLRQLLESQVGGLVRCGLRGSLVILSWFERVATNGRAGLSCR